ncbi:MAG TPA: LytTR family DNA-binding domain-containing protein, partial [Thermoanaerobaculia bacterium]|nr:LytTR family DNA-binding domain-containing protein [Thermoanaerobaculia bacterium]
VEDEPLARRRLRRLLAARDDIEVIGAAADGDEALSMIASLGPDLLFLDIQMPGMGGFDVLAELGGKGRPAVIFTTAYDQFALRAFEVHALDYVLKPFDEERLSAALDRALPLIRSSTTGSEWTQRFIVRSAGRILFLRAEDIDWIAAAGNYVYLHAAGVSHLIRATLKTIERKLDPERFLRIHRSAIVNIDAVREVIPASHGDCELLLRDGSRIACSRTFSERLRAATRP